MKGSDIRQLMKDKNIKVNDIARMFNVTHVAVSNVIHGKNKSARISEAIATAIDLPVSELWPDDQPAVQEAA